MPQKLTDVYVHALTHRAGGTARRITTPVEIKNTITGKSIETKGLWDTGATGSVVTKSVASALGLDIVGKRNVRGVHGVKEVNMYFINITLNNKNITIDIPATECDELSADRSTGMLIGMNIISRGDFAITNFQGNTTMSFRVPSLQDIDFVANMKSNRQNRKIKSQGRNDLCSCGSGKKYKHCCGIE